MTELGSTLKMMQNSEKQILNTQKRANTFIKGIIVTRHGLYAVWRALKEYCSEL